MSDTNNNASGGGVGILGLLGLIFVVLKLTNYIDWSWWYVTMPFWIGIPILLVALIFGLIFIAIFGK
jgi:hypothetical protein